MRDEETAALISPEELVERLRHAVDNAADDASSLFPTDPLNCYQEAWQGLLARLAHLIDDLAGRHSGSMRESAHEASKQIRDRVTFTHNSTTSPGRD